MINGQLSYDLQMPQADPFECGIPQDVLDKSEQRLMARGIYDPTDEQITDMCMLIWNDEREWERDQ